MEMKRCKECGEYFTPKSMRSQYCDKLHYRPCPICGKPVEAKYLSDPARCCSKECQQAMRSKTNSEKSVKVIFSNASDQTSDDSDIVVTPDPIYKQSSLEIIKSMIDEKFTKLSDVYNLESKLRKSSLVKTYTGVPVLGFIPGHEYALMICKPEIDRPYIIRATYDFDDSKVVDLWIDLSSKISIERNFA